ncbi:MAG: hypothetical protein IMW90_15615 [Thermogemmatispora sp.]|nr:hypothetical protein [Thermogemmatispora sp.]
MCRRLCLENDERCWSVRAPPICEASGLPLVVDNLHHALNGGAETPLERLPWERILTTWGRRRPKLHYAEQDPGKRPVPTASISMPIASGLSLPFPGLTMMSCLSAKPRTWPCCACVSELGLIAAGPCLSRRGRRSARLR